MIVEALPPHLVQTLFFKAAEFPIPMRHSTKLGDLGIGDRIPQPRGHGMKVFDVQGKMFNARKEYPTQDIEFNNKPALELADAKTTKDIFDICIKYSGDKKELYRQLEARDDIELHATRLLRYESPGKGRVRSYMKLTRNHSQLGVICRLLTGIAIMLSSTLLFLKEKHRRNCTKKQPN